MLLLDTTNRKTVLKTAPRAVFCVVDHLYRSLAIAADAAEGTFTNAGRRIALGETIDFRENPVPHDEEWRIEWFKFYFGLDLAHAYAKTGERRFPRSWEKLVRAFITQIPNGFDSADVAARRVQNWIYAWRKFAETPFFSGFSDGFEEMLLASLKTQIAFIRENLTAERNHRTLELYALFIAALALPELDPDKELLRFSLVQLEENLFADLQTDGVQREQSTDYHLIVLRSFLGLKKNARLFGLRISARADERVEKACEFAMHIHRPDGFVPAISDGDSKDFRELLKLAAELFGRADFLYVATNGKLGLAPNKRLASFEKSGYFTQRSGWGDAERAFADENYLVFDCGHIGDGGHGHYDLLSVEIAGGGQPLVIDAGRYTYSEEGAINWRHYFKGTRAHNTVCVDGLDQTAYRRGRPKKLIAAPNFIERITLENLDILSGQALSPMYDAVHTRRIFFVRNEFWVIFDRLESESFHHYDLRFHLTPQTWNHFHAGENDTNCFVRTADLSLVFERGRRLDVEPSWYSPEYGIKHRVPCVSVTEKSDKNVEFLTVVKPRSRGEKLPRFEVERDGVETSLRIETDGFEDVLRFRLNGEKFDFINLETRGVTK